MRQNEMERLDLQHHVLVLLMSGELHLAPLRQPQRIVDLGTGTGIWAIEMADRYPEAQIIGTDLSPVQPLWCVRRSPAAGRQEELTPCRVPYNVSFEVDDLEAEWLYRPNYFDMVHARYLLGSVSDWRGMIAQAYR